MGSSPNDALPAIDAEFGVGAITLSRVTTSFMFAAAAFLVPIGRLADIYVGKRIFIQGASLYALSCALATLAPLTLMAHSSMGTKGSAEP